MAKTLHQINNNQGQCTSAAHSAPGCFPQNANGITVAGLETLAPGTTQPAWGTLFSSPQPGNDVEFYTTGAEYFEKVADAISRATSSIFITGWQINHDVELVSGKTLFECLQDAMKCGASVYVMPWMAPPGPIDTGYFMTLLAVHHLNAMPNVVGRAHCLPAPAQSDQGTLGIVFSHHQKLVVIDNKRAFVGGLDLAYGRRDDNDFSLKSNGRKLNELYNPCVPAIHELTHLERKDCVTTAELLAATFTRGTIRSVATFATSPAGGTVSRVRDAVNTATDAVGDVTASVADWWNNLDLFDCITGPIQDAKMDAAQWVSRWAWSQLDTSIRGQLIRLRDTGGANAANAASAVFAWLNGFDLSNLPPKMLSEVSTLTHALTYGLVAGINTAANIKPEHYARLFEKSSRAVPTGAATRDASVQPRMPWHDVQCSVIGPSVFDLSQNFVQRWNSVASLFERSFSRYRDPVATKLLRSVGLTFPNTPKAPRIDAAHVMATRDVGKRGGCWVQVLRSASRQMQHDEAIATGRKLATSPLPQNNCLKAMLTAISGAQKFIYIEGQFFQTAHGAYGTTSEVHSGPMAALLNLRSTPVFDRFKEMLQIKGVQPKDIPGRIRWAKIDDVLKEAQGSEFINDLNTILKNVATVEVMRLLGKPQSNLQNPIGKALINSITRAIDDEQPFHVYMVLPAHPEGTLDTLNIMSQIHLTMQSLVFGEHSLVNGVRRAILAHRYRKSKKMGATEARKLAEELEIRELVQEVSDDWQQYMTLLNLRNWDTLGGKPVTEQIYVHSKLLIADDRVAVLGSANINDRSMLGDRDSELAVVIHDDTPKMVKLDGTKTDQVGAVIHQLRRELWRKHFGLKSRNRKAPSLDSESILDSPAAAATWNAIQSIAKNNSNVYEDAFWFAPRSGAHPQVQPKEAADKEPGPPPGSLWPTWKYTTYLNHAQGGKLLYRMPFDPLFWREAERGDTTNSWNLGVEVQAIAPTTSPRRVQGFIVALPTNWTARENNLSIKTHIGSLANVHTPAEHPFDASQKVAGSNQPQVAEPTA